MGLRQFRRKDGYEPVDLLNYAHGHFVSAEVLFSTSAFCFDSGGYIAHVAVELLFEAVLLHLTGAFPGDHGLGTLLASLERAGHQFMLQNELQGGLYVLERFEHCRYPKPDAPVQIGHSDLAEIRQLWDALVGQLPAPLHDAWHASDRSSKGGRVLMTPTSASVQPSVRAQPSDAELRNVR